MSKSHKVSHMTFRSFIIACLYRNIQPLMHVRDGEGYLYYIDVSKRDTILSPSASKAVLDKIWNEIGILRVHLRECFLLVNRQDPTIREFEDCENELPTVLSTHVEDYKRA